MESDNRIKELFAVGAHFGFVKSRRHPSVKPFIFGKKERVEIFDLEKTAVELDKALQFIGELGKENAVIVFVGGKSEAREAIERSGKELKMPYVASRWIGGTLTNFPEIKRRLARLEELTTARERGELAKYTKKERLLIDREIAKLEAYFGGIQNLKAMPKALFVVDPKKEIIAVREAKKMKIPVVALAGSDTNLHDVDYAIPSNDASRHTISYILDEVVKSYKSGIENSKLEIKNSVHDHSSTN
ncbi:MAG TPA: 30S ribosomal protein S2 [Candidatus Paceibacterota bacterium]